MAARRLLILMLAVLAVSTLAAALIAPRPEPVSSTATEQDDEAAVPGPNTGGRLFEVGVRAGALRPETVRLHLGDQLELTVRSRSDGQVEIPRFGLIEDAGPGMPARFSLLMSEPGNFAVRLAGTRRDVARIAVSAPR
ncbi:MAG: hypothetical protein ACRDJ5_00160 [Actinomycetota bacterium]